MAITTGFMSGMTRHAFSKLRHISLELQNRSDSPSFVVSLRAQGVPASSRSVCQLQCLRTPHHTTKKGKHGADLKIKASKRSDPEPSNEVSGPSRGEDTHPDTDPTKKSQSENDLAVGENERENEPKIGDQSANRESKPGSLTTLVAPVAEHLRILREKQEEIVDPEAFTFMVMARQAFGIGDERFRPAIVFLVSEATCSGAQEEISAMKVMKPQQMWLAQVMEMVYAASLLHANIPDDPDAELAKSTRKTLLTADSLFAQSCWYLANLERIDVIRMVNEAMRDSAGEEIKQRGTLFDCNMTLKAYMKRCSSKTAALIAVSAKCAALFNEVDESICDQMYSYGLHLGLAFQIVDDILDFTESPEKLGKPAGSLLAKGVLTAPVLFALESQPKLRELISAKFDGEGSLAAAIAMVTESGGIDKARQLAWEQGQDALESVKCLPDGRMRLCLEGLVDYALNRIDNELYIPRCDSGSSQER